jgi:hypothetical protein
MDIPPFSPLKVNEPIGGTRCLLHQGSRISQARNPHEAGSKQSLLGILLNPENGGDMFL